MPLYLVEFGYTPEAWAGLVKSPENREETVRRILEDAGCKLHNLWYAFGESDGFALIEAPDTTTAAGLSIAITSSGAFRKFETHVLMTQGELLEALEKAGEVAYTAPGAAVHA
ncbi:MAG TPA: GYD domain-containing protein [Gaiellaceae bacterium]|nr:GYD domain-containing protein [Gaiellaceae bacterium]